MLRIFVATLFIAVGAGSGHAGPLFDAAGHGDLAMVERLLGEGVPVDQPGHNAETPLIAAALAGQTAVAELLIARGADVMARNRGGLTALHAAAYGGSVEAARLLLDHGAAIEDRANISGATPLILAAEENRIAVVELLLARGADPLVKDRDGFSVLAQSWAKQRPDIVHLLKAHGATCPPAAELGSEDFYHRCVAMGK